MRTGLRLGLRSGGFAEVLDGLRAGDQIIAAGSTVTDVARVRVATASAAR